MIAQMTHHDNISFASCHKIKYWAICDTFNYNSSSCSHTSPEYLCCTVSEVKLKFPCNLDILQTRMFTSVSVLKIPEFPENPAFQISNKDTYLALVSQIFFNDATKKSNSIVHSPDSVV